MSNPNSIAGYARVLRPPLARSVFAPAHSRLWWLPVHLAIIASAMRGLAAHPLSWPLALTISAIIGVSFAGLTFLGHETLHGGVVRHRRVRGVVGFLGFLPFTVSPRLWVEWHNRVHHGSTNQPGTDPDAYPTLEGLVDPKSGREWLAIGPAFDREGRAVTAFRAASPAPDTDAVVQ